MTRNFDILSRQATPPATLHPSAKPSLQKVESAHFRDRRAVAEDEIAKLVQQAFLLPGPADQPGAVAFCGVEEGAGCSWVCARAAEVLAEQVPGMVCVVDANLRSPSLHERFRVEMGAGLADALSDVRPVRDFTRATSRGNLRLMTAGAPGEEPNGALNAARLRARFSELRRQFDYLLIDTPPISSCADAVLLGQLADGIILVVGSHSTRREPARIAKESLEAAKVPILGAVLNRRTYPIPEALYQRL